MESWREKGRRRKRDSCVGNGNEFINMSFALYLAAKARIAIICCESCFFVFALFL